MKARGSIIIGFEFGMKRSIMVYVIKSRPNKLSPSTGFAAKH